MVDQSPLKVSIRVSLNAIEKETYFPVSDCGGCTPDLKSDGSHATKIGTLS